MKIMPTFASQKGKNADLSNAKIAQLVEHNLAKVGVAGSSPVFRSNSVQAGMYVRVVELVDTLL